MESGEKNYRSDCYDLFRFSPFPFTGPNRAQPYHSGPGQPFPCYMDGYEALGVAECLDRVEQLKIISCDAEFASEAKDGGLFLPGASKLSRQSFDAGAGEAQWVGEFTWGC